MKQSNDTLRLIYGLLVICLIMMVALSLNVWYRTGLGVTMIALLFLVVYLHRFASVERSKAQREEAELHHQQELLHIVHHLRHDWMNDVQIMYSYTQLQKYDKLHTAMDKINMKLQRESLLSKLGDPGIISFIYAYRVNRQAPFSLEVELEKEIQLRHVDPSPGLVGTQIKEWILCFGEAALQPNKEELNFLNLEMDVEEGELLLDFIYRGDYEKAKLQQILEQKRSRWKETRIEPAEFDDHEAAVTVRLPYRNK